ncbi:hypothetical protein RQN30_02475 [Arcanobacterium hippocoleae]
MKELNQAVSLQRGNYIANQQKINKHNYCGNNECFIAGIFYDDFSSFIAFLAKITHIPIANANAATSIQMNVYSTP